MHAEWIRPRPTNAFEQCLSETNGGVKCSTDTDSTVSLSVATTSTPVCLHEHEVLQWQHSTRRVCLHGVEHVDAELVAQTVKISGLPFIGKVREQDEVAVWIAVAVGERERAIIHLANIRLT